MSKRYNVLFLCTGNSARSILAEATLNREGGNRFRTFSAGSFPKGEVHPEALKLLGDLGYPTDGLRSKSWDEFAAADAPQLDFIFTVCDNAAGETCPIWPGKPITAHWGIPIPPQRIRSIGRKHSPTLSMRLSERIDLFLALPLDSIEMALSQRLREIGKTESPVG